MMFVAKLASLAATAICVAACSSGSHSTTQALPTDPPTSTTATSRTPGTTPTRIPDPCAAYPSLDGQPLANGLTFGLNESNQWRICVGGVAAGSGEKLLIRTRDGGATWLRLSRTMLGGPTPEAGVGQIPNGTPATALLFLDDLNGWLGLGSPGQNLYRTRDGGVTWDVVPILAPGDAVRTIAFKSPQEGRVVTEGGVWLTSDGGDHWSKPP